MDDTQQSRISDAAAAATRKRRSSILKSQRPPRTPFSELEFNVATPTDAAKSRRVSFSRRTGVAEFVTNEATTTWKNFYEEHNKSLESSGNESGANQQRAPVGHIGKRIFDQQFQEVEAVDFGSTLDDHANRHVNTSMNNVNFTEQLAALECTGDDKNLEAPQQNFEMSAFTDQQSKLFGDDFTAPVMGEMSGRIEVNFSAIQTIGEVKDDLDEIQKDLERAQSNFVCPGPFTGRKSLSEYIEVDLNATHVSLRNDEDDMSITDTIQSPKVQDVSRNCSSSQIEKKLNLSKDWVADKENLPLNPYVAPQETTNFAINDDSDKILVFDGRRLTVQSDKEADMILKNSDGDFTPPVIKESKNHQRKTIVLNMNDDLPNFVDDPMSNSTGLMGSASFKHSVMYDDDDISITQPLVSKVDSMPEKNMTLINEQEIGNISLTQAVGSMIPPNKTEKRRTIVFENDNCDISMTQALHSKIIAPDQGKQPERRRTILYENDTGNISITQAIPAIIVTNEDHYKQNIRRDDISTKHPLVSKVNSMPEKNVNLKNEHEFENISITQAVSNVFLPAKTDKRRTIVFENDSCDISITQALHSKIIAPDQSKQLERRRTILYENDTGNISITQVIPAIIVENEDHFKQNFTRDDIYTKHPLVSKVNSMPEKNVTLKNEHQIENISITQAVSNVFLPAETDKRRTIVFESDTCDISMTQALPSRIIAPEQSMAITEKRKTILYENDTGNISVTQVIPANILVNVNDKSELDNGKRRTMVFDNIEGDISMTQVVPSNLILLESTIIDKDKISAIENERRKTIVFEEENCDISMTQVLPSRIMVPELNKPEPERRKTIIYDDDLANISVTQAIPTNIILKEDKNENKTVVYENVDCDISMTQALPENLIVSVVDKENKSMIVNEKRKTVVFENEDCDISITQNFPAKILGIESTHLPPERRKTILYEIETGNISITHAIPANDLVHNEQEPNDKSKTFKDNISITKDFIDLELPENCDNIVTHDETIPIKIEKREAIVFGHENCDISMTQVSPDKIMLHDETKQESERRKTTLYDNILGNVSVNQAVAVNVLLVENDKSKSESVVCEKVHDDIFISQEAPPDLLSLTNDDNKSITSDCEKQKTSEDRDSDVSPSQVMSSIHIIRDVDIEGEAQTDRMGWDDEEPRKPGSPLSIEYNEEADAAVTADLPKKLSELRTLVREDSSSPNNRHYEKILSSDLENMSARKSENQEEDVSKGEKSFKDANDTNELLEMLSHLTDKSYTNESEVPAPRIEVNEPRRLSMAPSRQSIVLSREDLLNNISMAQAALQRSLEIDESLEESPNETPIEVNIPSKNAVRISNEVVKKLHFEDESTSDASSKSELRFSPLKKTAFGETSYMKEKSKVIPSYLKDVSDGIKALMSDLVKPTADVTPFQPGGQDKSLMRQASTCSTQIQANLITTSQIDLEAELTSETDFDIEKAPRHSTDRSPSRRSSPENGRQFVLPEESSLHPNRLLPKPGNVIVFDHHNPLNNVLLTPIDFADVHQYNPPRSHETIYDNQSLNSSKRRDSHDEVNVQVVGSVAVSHAMQSGDSVPDKLEAPLLSNISKRESIDEGVTARVCELKDTKVNTVIAMKDNKELLEASSSLTLVDDALMKNDFDVDLGVTTQSSSKSIESTPNSPVQVIYHNDEQIVSDKVDSEFTSTEELIETVKTKGKKRIYSPAVKEKHKYSELSALEITPKPVSKMQKISTSPCYESDKVDFPTKLSAEKEESFSSKPMDVDSEIEKTKEKSVRKSKSKSPKTKMPAANVTVQQLITQYRHPEIDQDAINKQIKEASSRSNSSTAPNTASMSDLEGLEVKSPDIVSSFTSSNNQNDMAEACSVTTTATESKTHSTQSRSMKLDWQPEVPETNLESECESSVNVVAKIDMLPFMGSHECEWESSGADTWVFRLLHGRLRLSVRLAHRHDNATRTRVLADTPVRAVVLDLARHDKKNTVAQLSVEFAAEAMRYYIARGCGAAGAVPALLRRCAAAARVALRWGRAMLEARAQLAYTLTPDGTLSLKVANIPLRSVWEVTMRLELVVADARSPPWPRARDVRVARVVAAPVPPAELRRALAGVPADWGHVPRTVWKIFRYLKYKTRDDDVLGL